MNATNLLVLAFCVATEIGRELCFKVATNAASQDNTVRDLALSPVLWCGIALWAVEMLAWIRVLQSIPLGIAFPIMTLTFVGVPVACHVLLNERLNRSQWAGALLVFVGVVIVGFSGATA
jgi:undecaprenyl phosphate-alpha-L-ara4N flippase subunit ArnE